VWPALVGSLELAIVLRPREPGRVLGVVIFVGFMSALIISGAATEQIRRSAPCAKLPHRAARTRNKRRAAP
jgi:hypothetical protein